MRWLFVSSVAAVLCSVSAQADEPITLLQCNGYNQTIKDAITHRVAIYADRAFFDDTLFNLRVTPTTYTLFPRDPNNSMNVHLISIDRLNGSYFILPVKYSGAYGSKDFSRAVDDGCIVVRRKF